MRIVSLQASVAGLLLGAGLLMVGCGATKKPELRRDGLYQLSLDYRIRSDNPQGYGFVSPDWRVDNFVMSKRPPEMKTGADWLTTISFDHQDDGTVDHRERVPLYDLRLVHRQHNSELWVRAVPLDGRTRERDLQVLAREYVESVASKGYVKIEFRGQVVHMEQTQYATRVIEGHQMVVSGFPAYAVTFDVADVDQLQMSQNARYQRVRVVLIKTNLNWQTEDRRTRGRNYPVMLVVGYASYPEGFAQDLPALDSLLDLIEFRRGGTLSGSPGPVTTGPPPSAQSAPPARPQAPAPNPTPTPQAPSDGVVPSEADGTSEDESESGSSDGVEGTSGEEAAPWEGG